ncbi:hypothetical protein [Nannocystis pusilla]|uniref:hypothetical protein n=1 Tax=Nannocystis pusilla TaxID=889268 RepID=UPI003B791CE5
MSVGNPADRCWPQMAIACPGRGQGGCGAARFKRERALLPMLASGAAARSAARITCPSGQVVMATRIAGRTAEQLEKVRIEGGAPLDLRECDTARVTDDPRGHP